MHEITGTQTNENKHLFIKTALNMEALMGDDKGGPMHGVDNSLVSVKEEVAGGRGQCE